MKLFKHIPTFVIKKNYEKKLSTYKYAALSSLFIASIGLLIYINKKRKQAYQIVALHQQIETLEGLNNIKDEAKMFILRDFEVAKQIAMLRYTQKEQSAKFIKELNRFNITQNNSLLTTQWDNFYKHIDLSFDNFYTLLTDNFSGFKTEEIAAIWMQSIFSVHKYKTNIRKKLKTPEGANIIAFLMSAPPFQ